MDTKKEAKKYLNKYFKAQYLKETDDEYKSLVRLLNKALRIHDVVGRSEQFYCAEWNKVGYVCEEGQCDKCRKTESM
jgi:hypothetical protein